MNNVETINVSQPNYAGKLTHKELKLIGEINLNTLAVLVRHDFDFLDISEAEFGIDEEEWSVCLGWSHSGPVYGNSGWRDVDVNILFHKDGVKGYVIEETGEFVPKNKFEEDEKYVDAYVYNSYLD